MKVFIDRKKDEVWVSDDNEVVLAEVVKIKPVIETPEVDQDIVDYKDAEQELKESIKEAKEKAELFNLGIETQANLDLKIDDYRSKKTAYDIAKGKI